MEKGDRKEVLRYLKDGNPCIFIHHHVPSRSPITYHTMPHPKASRALAPAPIPHPPQPHHLQIHSLDFLDPSIIPSLPPPGGSVGHFDLIGRSRIDPSSHSNPGDSRMPSMNQSQDQLRPEGMARPGLVKRSSSFEGMRGGNRAGVGAGGGGGGHGRNWSLSGSEGIATPSDGPPGVVSKPSAEFQVGPRADVDGGLGGRDGLVRTRGISRGRGHGRTWSDSATRSMQTRPRHDSPAPSLSQSTSAKPPARPTAALESCLKLGPDSDLPKISKLLITIQALIPPSRLPSPGPPPPQTGLLHPITLLTPLAIILEALVLEREVLKGSHTSSTPRLPPLRDGSSFQLLYGHGELDWRVTQAYILAVGMVLDTIGSLLRKNGDQVKVGELKKTMKMYVGKMRKVLGDIAGMYVDGYGFVRDCWDEEGMKGGAGEVGRWGEMYDA